MRLLIRLLVFFGIFTLLTSCSPIEKRADDDTPVASEVDDDKKDDSKNTKDKDIPEASEYKSGDETKTDDKKKETKTDDKKDDDKKTTSASGSEQTMDSKSATATDSKSKDDKDDDKKKTTDKPKSTSIDPRDPPGGISMVSPGSTESTYLKIGDYATFSWKYTSLKVTPKNLDIIAVCSQNSQTVTIETKHPAKDTKFIWDTKKSDKNSSINLLTSKYTLKMYDSNSNASSTTQNPGHLTPLSYTLGLYRPKSYSSEAGDSSYVNGGMGLVDLTAAKWVFSMGILFAGTALHIILS